MNIGGKSRISTPTLKKETVSGSSGRNDVILSFYGEPPSYELSLDEFEEYALARLKVCFVTICLCFEKSRYCLEKISQYTYLTHVLKLHVLLTHVSHHFF